MGETFLVPYANTPLTDDVRTVVADTWGIDAFVGGERLFGGEESAAFKIADHVIRIGPTWRTTAELEWCHQIASAAAREVPEAIAPLATASGATVVRVRAHPVSVWPHVEGRWVDDDDDRQWEQAADLLARLHRALAKLDTSPRPDGAGTMTSRQVPGVDTELQSWLEHFDAAHQACPIHGDFYAGNLLARDGDIVGLLDWDEALLTPQTRELAWAAWEFGDGLWADDLTGVTDFITAYREAAGPAEPPDGPGLRNLVRHRLLGEMLYIDEQAARAELTDDDIAYRQRQEEVCLQLRLS